MFSRWFSSTRLSPKLVFDARGELEVMHCAGVTSYLRGVFFGGLAYLYFLYQLNDEGTVGRVRKVLLPVSAMLFAVQLRRSTKYLLRLTVMDGGKHVKLERYPLLGYGHPSTLSLAVGDFEGLFKLDSRWWTDPFGWNKAFYKLRFTRQQFGRPSKDYVLLRIPKNYNKEALKLLLLNRPVNDKTLRQIELAKVRTAPKSKS